LLGAAGILKTDGGARVRRLPGTLLSASGARMHFVSFPFLCFFLVVFVVYWNLRAHRQRLVWLVVASCYFYVSWNPLFLALILFSASVDYLAARWMVRMASPRWRGGLLVASVGTNLSLLAFFKYTNFLLANLTGAFNLVGVDFDQPVFEIALPLGISFYTFETISYVVDVYRGKTRAIGNLVDYALYIMFFPHLMAGPIVRPNDFLPQLQRRKRLSWNRVYFGCQLILRGVLKKAVLADRLAAIVDPVFQDPGRYSSGSLWLAVLGYALQIYGDFSGYSDMAIGLAHCFGFKLPANFNFPYFAANISDFWRRWHISLSTWLRDYVYIPLGGSRHDTWATYRNLMLTMILGGLWHGASWTFVAWGLLHGGLLAAHRAVAGRRWLTVFRPLRIPLTFLTVCLGWVFFRSQTFGDASMILAGLFHPVSGTVLDPGSVLVVLGVFVMFLVGHLIGTAGGLTSWEKRLPEPVAALAWTAVLLLVMLLLPEDCRGFIYFHF
jgi:alginate O-acetyltransferase complex protein AlgI